MNLYTYAWICLYLHEIAQTDQLWTTLTYCLRDPIPHSWSLKSNNYDVPWLRPDTWQTLSYPGCLRSEWNIFVSPCSVLHYQIVIVQIYIIIRKSTLSGTKWTRTHLEHECQKIKLTIPVKATTTRTPQLHKLAFTSEADHCYHRLFLMI